MSYPQPKVIPPIRPEFNSLYDFSKVPPVAVEFSNPHGGIAQPNCTSSNNNPTTTCSRSCGCIRPEDIFGCSQHNQFALTYGNIYLTIDDGPTEFTPIILDWMKANSKKATFFVIGASIHGGQQPNNGIWNGDIQTEKVDVLKRAFDEGHEIGVHCNEFLTSLVAFGIYDIDK